MKEAHNSLSVHATRRNNPVSGRVIYSGRPCRNVFVTSANCSRVILTLRYHSCQAARTMHTTSEPMLNHATRALVASAHSTQKR